MTELTSRAVTCQGVGHLQNHAVCVNLRHVTPAATLKALRLRANLTQEQLAKKAGIDRSWVNQMERGKRPITRSPAVKLARVLGVSPEELGAEESVTPRYRPLHSRQEELEAEVLKLVADVRRLTRRVLDLERQVQRESPAGETGANT